jgi:site-specific recombinase XerD
MAQGTLYNYGLAIKKFFITLQKPIEEINSNDIRVYLYKYQEINNISNRSLDKLRQTLSRFFSWRRRRRKSNYRKQVYRIFPNTYIKSCI